MRRQNGGHVAGASVGALERSRRQNGTTSGRADTNTAVESGG